MSHDWNKTAKKCIEYTIFEKELFGSPVFYLSNAKVFTKFENSRNTNK